MKFRKGDRVEFDDNGVTKYGVVSKGGAKKIEVIADGAEFIVKGHAAGFRPSNQPIPMDSEPSPMDDYGVKGYKEFKSFDGGGFNAYITYKGKKILEAFDEGNGGEVSTHGIGGTPYSRSPEEEKFYADAKAWAIQFGDSNGFGAVGMWFDWYVHERPYGVTARMYWDKFNKKLASWKSA